ncbi:MULTISPECIES: hypothetical protein [Bacillaceae]|uniref:hypothetical protein n=1 Tax=Bacillaceae TaxID=186817 RepID=UPI000BFA8243|nr:MULTISPECIES: hypothetical protein [Bacillaceae]MBT2664839.1 hypothetical protein [Bacillus sp. ISL-4]MBT2671404.1 hypothetical protein [Streptomyces sp. ISL-14]PEZ82313.1 hypothetical protein CN380_06930 [Bacillus sp. AFS017274]
MYSRVVFEISTEEVLKGLLFYKSKQESEIESIKGKIHKYEQKRRAEEAWYQSLSPFKRFFTGRAPSHHQAVEHLVNVKDRYKKIEMIKQKVAFLNQVIGLLEAETEKREMNLPSDIIKEIMDWQKAEGTPR